jgi:Uma2 family endonuclease
MTAAAFTGEQRVILDQVSWATYVALADEAHGRRGRMTYHRGTLEIMSPSKLHENVARLIGRLVEAYTEEAGIEVCSVKSTTFRRPDLQSGFEADESYYFGDVQDLLGKAEIDLAADRPPDLIIEVDISRSSMEKFTLYGGIGVPEVWRFEGQTLHIYVRRQADQYEETTQSSALPLLTLQPLAGFLEMRGSCGETQIVRSFRTWVQQQLSSTPTAKPTDRR